MADSEPPRSARGSVANILRGLRIPLSPETHDYINNAPGPPQTSTNFSSERPIIRSIPRNRGSKRVQLTQNARRAKLNSLFPDEDNDELEKAFNDMSGQPGDKNSPDNGGRRIADIEEHGRDGAGSISTIRKSRIAVGLGVSIPVDGDFGLGIDRTVDVRSRTHDYRQGALAACMASRDGCPPTPNLNGSSSSAFDLEDNNESRMPRALRLKYGHTNLPETPKDQFQHEITCLPSTPRSTGSAFGNISPSSSPSQTHCPPYSQYHSNNKSERPPLPVATPPHIRRRELRESFASLQIAQPQTATQHFASWLYHQERRSARRISARAVKERSKGKKRLCDRRSIDISPIYTTKCTSTRWSIAKIGDVDDIDFSAPGWTCGSTCTDRLQIVLVLQGANSIGCDCPSNMSDKRSDNVEVGTCREDEDWSDDDGFFDRGKKGAMAQEQMWVALDRMKYQDYAARSRKDTRQKDI